MATFGRLPLDVQRKIKILVPDATYRASVSGASFSGAPAVTARHGPIDTLLGFHVWSRHTALVASDVRRLRFFASTGGGADGSSTDGAALRVSKSHPIVRNELRFAGALLAARLL